MAAGSPRASMALMSSAPLQTLLEQAF
ncbi:MAG: hypothetical protein QOF50_787, partial [Gaiellaceae bacterium]|nr:hypothetical protein [Gaiellaceae bacterium]